MNSVAAARDETLAATAVARPGTDPDPVKLLYICGYGRSGSTLFDILLGDQPELFGGGEIDALTRHVWDKDEYCACGARVRECRFWSAAFAWWQDGDDGAAAAYRGWQRRFDPIVSVARRRSNSAFRAYAEATVRLFRGLRAAAGRDVIVDSSKLPGRGFALAAMPGIDLHVVHLVRDPRGVAWSLMKSYRRDESKGLQKEVVPKPAVYTAARWAMVNLASEQLCRRVGAGRSLRVRYEDLVADPAATLRRVGELVGASIGPTAAEFRPGHQVAGNRLRMLPAIRLSADEGWRSEMPAGSRKLVSRLLAPMLRRYGYAVE